LNELVRERQIEFTEAKLARHVAHFYWPRRHRYARRQIRATLSLIGEFSDPVFTRALGQHGELLADAGFAHTGFRIRQRKVRAVGEKHWTKSNHDLDRVVERDGVLYGVEIKNQLGYIDQTEFQTKLEMCEFFEIRPMFIARMMPRNYISQTASAGGFSLLMKNQHYPLMSHDLARRVKATLNLPVFCIAELPDTTLKRFENWHEKQLMLQRKR